MFWKKKNDNAIAIEIDSNDRRNGVRIKPMDEIIINHEAQQFKLIDISFSGLAFQSTPDLYNEEDSIEISMSMPLGNTGILSEKKIPITCSIKIIHSLNSIYHCRFINLSHQNKLLLDRFILNEQKRQILSSVNTQ
ncbi:MAG: PilZ domain-containing protein [Gammaproteobacteria bacterium]|nr:PilZ domain-containing protein [Gammaproteobacteria bacterium]